MCIKTPRIEASVDGVNKSTQWMPNACLLNQRRLAGCRNDYLWLRVYLGRQRAANRYRRRYASGLEQGGLIEDRSMCVQITHKTEICQFSH
jgi:hypothetical protein